MTPAAPLVTRRFTAALTPEGYARRRAPFVIPALDGRLVFIELSTDQEHRQAYVVYLGTAVAAADVLAKVPAARLATSAGARECLARHIRQVAAIPLGSVVELRGAAGGEQALEVVARRARRPPDRGLPG